MSDLTDDAEGFEPTDELNRAALRGILGWTETWQRDLAALLRSPTPLHSTVREALAAAIAPDDCEGAKLVMEGHETDRQLWVGIEKRKRDLEIGRKFAVLRSKYNYSEAVEELQQCFNASASTCNRAITSYNSVKRWVNSVKIAGTYYGNFSDEWLESFYIGRTFFKKEIPDNFVQTAEERTATRALWALDEQ